MAQWTFKPRVWLFSVGNGAMNTPRYGKQRNDACRWYTVQTARWDQCDYTTFFPSLRRDKFHARVGIRILLARSSHRMGDGPIFLKTSEPLLSIKSFWIRPLLNRSILLDSTFNDEICLLFSFLFMIRTDLSIYVYTPLPRSLSPCVFLFALNGTTFRKWPGNGFLSSLVLYRTVSYSTECLCTVYVSFYMCHHIQ